MIEILAIPGVILLIGAALLSFFSEKLRPVLFLVFPLIAAAVIILRPEGYSVTSQLLHYDLVLMQTDALSNLFGIVFALGAFVAGVYAFHMKELGQQICALGYAGGALGVTYAGDLLTLIIFWEIMAVASTWLIWAQRTPATDAAGMRYLIYHILGGGLLFAGILWHSVVTGSIAIETIPMEYTPANVLMLLGIAVNAAVIPLHTWLSDAYPKATLTGTIFMSIFTTKTAVYVLIRMYSGWEMLVFFGAAMAIYGIYYAVICKDMREILSYHIISQVGYMVAAIGVGSELAVNGAAAHAYNNILYKSLMFMAVSAVMYSAGTSKMFHLGGLYKKMPWVLGLYVVGGLSISGIPLFAGFVSKGMVIDAAGYGGYETIMLVLLVASVGTWLSVGLKLPYFTWFDKQDYEGELKPIPVNMYIAMGILAFACIFYGIFPNALYTFLPHETGYEPYTVYHLVEITQIALLTFVGFWLLRKKLAPELTTVLDLDWFYRKAAPATRLVFVEKVDTFYAHVEDGIQASARYLADKFQNPMRWLNPFTDEKNEASSYSPAMEVVMSFILLCFLVFAIIYFL